MNSGLSGVTIRELRRDRGWTQDDLARRARVSRNTVSNWERDVHAPGPAEMQALAKAFGITLGEPPRSAELRPERVQSIEGMPPRAYSIMYNCLQRLWGAGVPEENIEEARQLMSGQSFNQLHAPMLRARTEEDWVEEVEAAWDLIRRVHLRQGYTIDDRRELDDERE